VDAKALSVVTLQRILLVHIINSVPSRVIPYDFFHRILLTVTFLSMEQSRISNTVREGIFISEDFKKV
jgi:hypothetical protein